MPNPRDVARLHTPEELLAGAEVLIAHRDALFSRSAVLEASVALESYVRDTVFKLLAQKLDPLFVKWLEQRTFTDFDSRLSVITPMAIEREVDTQSALWNRYKLSRKIRHKAAHSGQHVTREEAREVLSTVRDWLAYLGSTAEVDLSLTGLKRYVELSGVTIQNERDATELVRRFYEKTRPAVSIQQEERVGSMMADMILGFDDYKVIIETKFSSHIKIEAVGKQLNTLVEKLPASDKYRKVVIIFSKEELTAEQEKIITLPDGTSGVYIKV